MYVCGNLDSKCAVFVVVCMYVFLLMHEVRACVRLCACACERVRFAVRPKNFAT